MKNTYTMEKLEMKFDMRSEGKTVRFMDFVVVAYYYWDAPFRRSRYGFHAYRPVESEDETGVGFCELRLECIDDLLADPADREGFGTEGEALLAAMQLIQRM